MDSLNLEKFKKLDGSPYGLALLGDNWLKRSKAARLLKDGFIIDVDIIKSFDDMCHSLKFRRSPLMESSEGALKSFPCKSRWNNEYDYGRVVGAKALDQVAGLREVSHLILTISKEIAEHFIPSHWAYSVEDYMSIRGGEIVTIFLKQYRQYRKKIGAKNHFITWVLEYQENGMVHFHLLFLGRYIAPIGKMIEWWPLSEGQGVRLGKLHKHQYAGHALARYLTHYITKDLKNMSEKRGKRMAAFMWFFRRRFYNMRHKVRNADGFYTLGIGREHFVPVVKWKLYEHDEVERLDRINYDDEEAFILAKAKLNRDKYDRKRLEREESRRLFEYSRRN